MPEDYSCTSSLAKVMGAHGQRGGDTKLHKARYFGHRFVFFGSDISLCIVNYVDYCVSAKALESKSFHTVVNQPL